MRSQHVYPVEDAFTMKQLLAITLFVVTAPAFVSSANAQGFGTLDSTQPEGATVAQILEKMGKQESAFSAARNDYTFRQDVKFNTISEDTNRPDGEYHQVTDVSFDGGGRRVEHVTFAPQNTIERVIMTESDMKDIENKLPFVLTGPELPQYDLTYLGRQKVDDLDTFVFDCKPKTLVKGKRYFQGKVWVDQQDNEIVLINGLTVPQDTRAGHEDLSPPYTTYYEQVDGKYWFPTYTKAEGILHFAANRGTLSQDVHVRTVVKYTDYKRFKTSVTIHYNGEDLPVEQPGAGKENDTNPMGTPPKK
jgi:hypothetical protein